MINIAQTNNGPEAMILTKGERMTDHYTFENPDAVRPAAFNGFKLDGNILTATLPSKSVVVLEIE